MPAEVKAQEPAPQRADHDYALSYLVKEGQVVEAGQLLLKIDETRATSGMRESAAQVFSLQARLARLVWQA